MRLVVHRVSEFPEHHDYRERMCRQWEDERLIEFVQLRRETQERMEQEIGQRIARNPVPNAFEFAMGAFVEQLEPQVREAIVTLRRKGYATHSSGFYGTCSNIQGLDGPFKIPLGSRRRLRAEGFEVTGGWPCSPVGSIRFWPVEPHLEHMKEVWDWTASLLPDLDKPAPATRTTAGDRFRAQYSSLIPMKNRFHAEL